MKALRFSGSVPRYATTKILGQGSNRAFWSELACLRLQDVEEPSLPTDDWVRVRTRFGGICGSDVSLVLLHSSTSTSPYTSFPFTVGHENTGRIAEIGTSVEGFSVGERVVVDPLLPCRVRGFNDLCPLCARGDYNLCRRFRDGSIASGML